jgi:kynurenine formamidase
MGVEAPDSERLAAALDELLDPDRREAMRTRLRGLEPQNGATDAARWLAERRVAMVGADNFAIEQIPFPDGEVFPVHQLLLRDRGVPLVEGLALDRLAATRTAEFLFVALPLAIEGGTASPLAPVAVL